MRSPSIKWSLTTSGCARAEPGRDRGCRRSCCRWWRSLSRGRYMGGTKTAVGGRSLYLCGAAFSCVPLPLHVFMCAAAACLHVCCHGLSLRVLRLPLLECATTAFPWLCYHCLSLYVLYHCLSLFVLPPCSVPPPETSFISLSLPVLVFVISLSLPVLACFPACLVCHHCLSLSVLPLRLLVCVLLLPVLVFVISCWSSTESGRSIIEAEDAAKVLRAGEGGA